jgi:hypothetical protein
MTQYIETERARYWPLSAELMAQYKDGTHTYKSAGSTLYWEKNGQYHRDNDKPAIISAAGRLEWQQNGDRHRDGDRPARIFANGHLEWHQNNKWHRSSGPAVIFPSGTLEWWINGEDITEEVRAWLADTEWRGTPEQIAEFKLRFG